MENKEFLNQMGKRIRAARLERNVTLVMMSKNVGLNTSNLSFMENGKTDAHVLTLKRIADALEMEVKDFL